MGGVAGHMDHLYDNQNLTFAKMKEIMEAASDADLDVEEKVDGQNLFLSYSVPEGKAKGARNKGHYRGGGLDAAGLATKFAGRGALEQAFVGGFAAFEKAVEALSDKEKQMVFGTDANIWYNAEIMDPAARNVINYDNKTLKIHGVGHFVYDKESNEEKNIPEGALETLDSALERMQSSLDDSEFSLVRKAVIQMQKLSNDEPLKIAKSRIDSALNAEGVSDSDTVQDYMFARLMNGIDTNLPTESKEELTRYLLKMKGNIGLNAIKKKLPKEDIAELREIINAKKMILKDAILPIEVAVHDFTVEILRGLESRFIADTGKEVQRLRQELSNKVNQIIELGPENPQGVEIMQRELNKIKDMSEITTPVEALVFDYDGHTYKFAGNFAPMNQILGMFRYGSSDKKLATESLTQNAQVLTEEDGKRVALLPGGFKPPHAGHYGLAKELSSLPNIDEVVVIIGKNPRFSEIEPEVSITAEQSKNLWDIYTRNNENIKVRIQEGKTPVADVYDLIADKNSFSEGDTVILGKSDKDVGDKRYARAQSYAEMHNPGVNVEEMIFPVTGGESMGGTALRNMIAAGQKERFMSKLPTHLNKSDLEAAWNMVTPLPVEGLNNFIDNTIEEMSAMAAGAVEGSVGASSGWGRANSYNPYRKRKKPKVKRAKRQRRR
jgi:hypothetical protein